MPLDPQEEQEELWDVADHRGSHSYLSSATPCPLAPQVLAKAKSSKLIP